MPPFDKLHQRLQRLYLAVLLLVVTLLAGMVGFILIERYNLLEAFYMTVITLGTVGFGEVKPLSDAGRFFVSLLILFNLSIFAYALSVITSLLLDGEFQKLFKYYKTLKQIGKLNQHVIICGYGRHGKQVATEFLRSGQAFVVIERNEEKLRELREQNLLYLEGDATHEDVLEEAGVMSARALLVSIPDEAESVYTVLTARQMNPQLNIISRASNEKSETKLKRAGADHTIMPERIGGFYMAMLIKNPDIDAFINTVTNYGAARILFEEHDYSTIKKELQKKTLGEMDILKTAGVNVVGLRPGVGDIVINPSADTTLSAGCKLVLLGNKQQMERFREFFLDEKWISQVE